MKKISTAELRLLEVINLCGGERLGYPSDFEVDLDDGRILSLIVSDCGVHSFFGKREEIIIPWCNIECFGEDAILVKIRPEDMCERAGSCKTSKKKGIFR